MDETREKLINGLKGIAAELESATVPEETRRQRLCDELLDLSSVASASPTGLVELLYLTRGAIQMVTHSVEEGVPLLARASAEALGAALAALETPGGEQLLPTASRNLEQALRIAQGVPAEERTPAEAPEAAPLPAPAVPAAGLVSEGWDAELLGEFATECREYIQSAESALLTLEAEPDNAEAINTVFRAFHTIKGTAAFVGIAPLTELSHHAETLLSRIREGEIRFGPACADLSLQTGDMLKELLQGVETQAAGGAAGIPLGYAGLLRVLTNPEAAGVDLGATPGTGQAPPAAGVLPSNVAPEETAGASAPSPGPRTSRPSGGEPAAEASVRVRMDRLDSLVDAVGELVIAHSMVAQDELVLGGRHELQRKVSHVGKMVRELQELTMSMRMVPFKGTFQKVQRLVRDVSRKSGKLVELVTEGEETEIDRNMVEAIADPLVHMIRNAVDHGIEPPDEREELGKPAVGTVRLSAFHAEGKVVVEIADDGRGLDRAKIIQKAISKGLIESDTGMSDSDVFGMVFLPGFSTAERITEVSGRGVGMDVVKRNVTALGGHIEISSELGKGSVFSIRLPLTLAITDGMLVAVAQERYIIPTTNIYLTFRPQRPALSTVAGRGEMVMFRDDLLPLFRLHRLFEIEGAIQDPTEALLVIIDDNSGKQCALQVDELLGQQQVVAKPLGEGIGKVQGVSGAAILGDGRVGLILDAAGITFLARRGSLSGDREGRRVALAAAGR